MARQVDAPGGDRGDRNGQALSASPCHIIEPRDWSQFHTGCDTVHPSPTPDITAKPKARAESGRTEKTRPLIGTNLSLRPEQHRLGRRGLLRPASSEPGGTAGSLGRSPSTHSPVTIPKEKAWGSSGMPVESPGKPSRIRHRHSSRATAFMLLKLPRSKPEYLQSGTPKYSSEYLQNGSEAPECSDSPKWFAGALRPARNTRNAPNTRKKPGI
jgi:hypothetical protein